MRESRKILVISQYFYPEQFRINGLCEEWVKRGYEVTVITGIPNYPQGEYYSGYGLSKKREENYRGVKIIRLPLIPRGKGKIQLIANYLSFVVSGWFWERFTKLKSDCVFVFEVSPMTQALPGVWYSRRRGIPCFLYVQDLWPDNVEVVTGIHRSAVLKPINRMVNYIYRHCAHIFVTSPSFAAVLKERGVPGKKVSYWPQYAEDFYRAKKKEKRAKDVFTIIFTGNIGYAQGLNILPKTAALLKEERIHFIMVGDGRYKEKFIKELEHWNVKKLFTLIGQKKPEQIPKLLAKCDAAFISFMDNPLFRMTIPAKLQSYMACGMPILAAAQGETRRIIEEAGCGICSPIGDYQQLAKNILILKAQSNLEVMGENALKYSRKFFNKNELLNQIDSYLRGEYGGTHI